MCLQGRLDFIIQYNLLSAIGVKRPMPVPGSVVGMYTISKAEMNVILNFQY